MGAKDRQREQREREIRNEAARKKQHEELSRRLGYGLPPDPERPERVNEICEYSLMRAEQEDKLVRIPHGMVKRGGERLGGPDTKLILDMLKNVEGGEFCGELRACISKDLYTKYGLCRVLLEGELGRRDPALAKRIVVELARDDCALGQNVEFTHGRCTELTQ